MINLGLTQFGPHASGLKITHAALHVFSFIARLDHLDDFQALRSEKI